ncbi:hypothetical protein JL721_11358 [Aureococcus anophagefferens]|nr:hypothetical protein JL721_11358 [Aureococcus anophagefferens]
MVQTRSGQRMSSGKNPTTGGEKSRRALTLRDKQGTKDVVSQLPHELALKILSFASADAVVAACGVAKHWRDLGGTDALWRPLCHDLWRGKLNFEGRRAALATARAS